MSDNLPLDPFGPTANPQLYVPRAATERALDHLAHLLGPEGHRLALLTGPPGLGKTQLLRMLAERLPREAMPLYLPIASLPLDGLCAFALAELRVPWEGDPEVRLVERAQREAAGGHRLVLLCDDADALGASVSKLAALVAEAGGGLAALLTCDDARASPLRTALGPGVPEVSLVEPMNLLETTRYVKVRLAEADVPPTLWRCFDPPTLEMIHREAKGVPRCVNQEAGALLRSLADRSLNGRKELPPSAPDTPIPVRAPDAATPAPRPAEPDIPPLRARRKRRRRYRVLRVVELGLATLVAGLVVMLVLRSGMPPMPPFDEPGPPHAASGPGQAPSLAAPAPAEPAGPPAVATGPAAEPGGAPAPAPQAPAVSAGPPSASEGPSTESAGPPSASEGPSTESTRPPSEAAPAEALRTPATASKTTASAPVSPPTPPSPPVEPPARAGPAPTPAVASAPPPAPASPAPPAESVLTQQPSSAPSPQATTPPPAAAEAPSAAAAKPVSVNVNADPWAQVEIDGKPVGVTPLAGVMLTPGNHVFRASLPDGRVIERTVSVGEQSRFVHFP